MKQILLILLILWSLCLDGQMGPCSIDGGDQEKELFFRTDKLPENYNLGVPGPNNFWLFGSLKSPNTQSFTYRKASTGRFSSQFNEAHMVLRHPDGKEVYFMNRSSRWYELGYAFPSEQQEGGEYVKYTVPIHACPPQSEDRITTYQTTFDNAGTEISLSFEEIRDASGSLYLSDGTYDADRIRRVKSITENGIRRLETSFLFVDQLTNDFLMEIQMDDENQIKSVLYKSQSTDPGNVPLGQENHFLLYPDVGYGDIRLEFNNFEPGAYSFVVFDIIGRRLWSKVYQISYDITIKEDLSFLPKGRYHYTIIDSNQNKIVTRRLAIIKS